MMLFKGDIADVDFRFVTTDETTTQIPKLQYRKLVGVNDFGCRWSPWTDVPLVVIKQGEQHAD